MSDKHLILWADPKSKIESFLANWDSEAVESIEVQEANLALQFLKVHRVSVLVASSEFGLEFWSEVESLPYRPVCVLLLDGRHLDQVQLFINRFSFFRILQDQSTEDELKNLIHSSVAEATLRSRKAQLRKESSAKYRELDSLNQGLEKIVEERTKHIEQTKLEEEAQLLKVRNLTRFIKDLSALSSIEDLLELLRREVRKLGQMGDPVLIQFSAKASVLYSFQSGHYAKMSNSRALVQDSEAQFSIRSLQRFLANELGRPFVKPLIFELRVSSVLPQGQRHFLALESFVSENESLKVSDFFSDRIETLSLALDRVLLESEHTEKAFLWERTFDSLQRPIAILDMDYGVLRSNRLFSREDHQSFIDNEKKCYQVFADRESPCEACPMGLALEKSETVQGTIRVGNKTYQVFSYPIILSQGQPTNAVNSYIDITQSRDLYLKLLQSEKMSAMGVLAGNIAHELNNPLTGIRSLAQVLMSESPQGSTLYSDLQEIEKATERSQKIIRNLQDFSRKENTLVESFSLDEIIEKTIPMLKALIRNHRLDLELHAGSAMIKGESQLIQQVIFNLINNACQAMKSGGVVTVTTDYDPSQKLLALVVRDTGPGIPEEVQERIFEAFFTTKKEGVGTGLGLSLSKEIIERHGGKIDFSSSPGQGTEFRVMLPEAQL